MNRRTIVLCACLFSMSAAARGQAQTVITTPTPTVSFVVSPDHNAVVPGTSTPLVSNYKFRVVKQSATGTVLQVQDLGKPLASDGQTLTYTSQTLTTLNQVLQMDVLTTGPGGSTQSTLSNPFVPVGPPAAAGSPNVR